MALPITVKFTGGAEFLFDNVKMKKIDLPLLEEYYKDCNEKTWTLKYFLRWIGDNLLKERPEMFFQGESVRPGILVLVNETDWELVGELDYVMQPNDTIVFMSTLHGG